MFISIYFESGTLANLHRILQVANVNAAVEDSVVEFTIPHCNRQVLVNQDIPYSLKRSILLDISRGLFYLHGHSPPIIHRDLTARNILFTPSMLAKIADLGNARMVEPHKLNKTMSTAPGTLVYMPPEAIGVQPKYDAKLDIFSFGHLSLYTAIKDFPDDLLPSTYPDPNNSDSLKARSEVQRREPYMVKLYKEFGKEHSLVKLIRQCLHNAPKCRPSAADVMELLEGLDVEKEVEDPYDEYEGMNRLEMVQLLKSKEKKESEPQPPLASPAPPQPAQPAQPRLPSPPAMLQAEDSLHVRVRQIQVSRSLLPLLQIHIKISQNAVILCHCCCCFFFCHREEHPR